MELHRSGKKAQWSKISQRHRNVWQRLANQTNGVATLGNVLTLVGFGLVVAGLVQVMQERYWLAVVLLFIGRCFDLLDGLAADRTGTKSPLGEKLDAGFDKLATVLAAATLAYSELVPLWALAVIFIPHIAIALLALPGLLSGNVLHPSRTGKYAMALAWVALGGFVLLAAAGWRDQQPFAAVAGVLAVASAVLGAQAAVGYGRALRRR